MGKAVPRSRKAVAQWTDQRWGNPAGCGSAFGTDSGAVASGPDTRVTPPTLHVATEQGAAALRVLP